MRYLQKEFTQLYTTDKKTSGFISFQCCLWEIFTFEKLGKTLRLVLSHSESSIEMNVRRQEIGAISYCPDVNPNNHQVNVHFDKQRDAKD